MTDYYDWKGLLRGRYRMLGIYLSMRVANPEAGRLRCLWWTLGFPHTHILPVSAAQWAHVMDLNEDLQEAISTSGRKLTDAVLQAASELDHQLRALDRD